MSGRYIINPKVTEYVDGFYRPLTEELGWLRRKAEEQEIPVILRDAEQFLVTLIDLLKPRRILEVGTAVGYSAACFAEAAGPEARVVTIEKDPEMAHEARMNLRVLELSDRVDVIVGDGRDVIPETTGPFDLVFIDAAKSHYQEFWDLARAKCRAGSVIVCDNVLLRAAVADRTYDNSPRGHHSNIKHMRKFTEKIMTDASCDTALMTVGDGLSVSYLRTVRNG